MTFSSSLPASVVVEAAGVDDDGDGDVVVAVVVAVDGDAAPVSQPMLVVVVVVSSWDSAHAGGAVATVVAINVFRTMAHTVSPSASAAGVVDAAVVVSTPTPAS